MADDALRPLNHGLITVGSAVLFANYVERTYITASLPLLAKTTQDCYRGVLAKYLMPQFGNRILHELDPLTLQQYFSGLKLPYPTISKIRDAFSSVLRSAVKYRFLPENPMEGVQMPPDKRGRRQKPFILPQQFEQLLALIPEPYASMVFTSAWTGLRVSELVGLKWRCIHADSITVEERFCRGDWSSPKTAASAATIGVAPAVIERLQRLKTMSVAVRAGTGTRHYQLVKASNPDDLVFQSVKDGCPMNDQNILRRYIRPAAVRLGMRVTWRSLRTSHATWLVMAGADPKSVQGQMRHSRVSTTMDIYAQIVSQAQRQAVDKLVQFAAVPIPVPVLVQ